MSKQILDNLFASRARVKLLKFLYRNYPAAFAVRELARRTQEPLAQVKQEIALMRRIGLIIKK